MRGLSINLTFEPSYREAGMPDPVARPELFEGVRWRRVLAYLVDLCCIGFIAIFVWLLFAVIWVLSFGMLGPALWFLFGLVPLAYHTLLTSGPHAATLGMRMFDLQLRSWNGEKPVFVQALAHTVLFYLSVGATGSLILLFSFFNRRKRTLHDVLAGMLMVRTLRYIGPVQ